MISDKRRGLKKKLAIPAVLLLSTSIILAGCTSNPGVKDMNEKQEQQVKSEIKNKEDLFSQVVSVIEKTENLKMTVELDGKTRNQSKGPIALDFNMSKDGEPYDVNITLDPLHYHIYEEDMSKELYGMEDYTYIKHPFLSEDKWHKVKAEDTPSLSLLFDNQMSFVSDFYADFNDKFKSLLDNMEMTKDDDGYSLKLSANELEPSIQYQLLKNREGLAVIEETDEAKENGLQVNNLQYTFFFDKETLQLKVIGVEEDWKLEVEELIIENIETGTIKFSDFNKTSLIEISDEDVENAEELDF